MAWAAAACSPPVALPATAAIEPAPTATPFLPRGFAEVAPSPFASAGPSEAAPGFPLDEAASRLNLFRSMEGLPALEPREDLAGLAQDQARTLASSGELRHDPSIGDRVAALGYYGALATHVFAVRLDDDDPLGEALQVVLTDPAHRATLLDPRFQYLGQGAASDGVWWYLVQVLAERGPGARLAVAEEERS